MLGLFSFFAGPAGPYPDGNVLLQANRIQKPPAQGLPVSGGPVWLASMDSALQQAGREHKCILLNFSGSDWCIPCISLRREVFETEVFRRYAADHLILVNADFPRNRKNRLPAAQEKRNEQLADRYNPEGHFPYTLLLDNQGRPLRTWDGFYSKGPRYFTEEISEAATAR